MEHNYSSVRLEITSKCNLNCSYCHNKYFNNQTNDMTYDEIIKLLLNLKKKYDIKKVLLTGGEPTMNPKLVDLVSFLTKNNIKADMVSNGFLLTLNKIKKLDAAGLKRIRISIDEVGETSSNRGSLSPKILWKNAHMVKENSNIQLVIHTVCSPTNVDYLFDIYKKVLEVGARRWRVFDIGFQGGVVDDKSHFNFNDYYDRLISSTQKIIKHYLDNNLKDVLDIEINNIFKTSFLDEYPDKNFDFKKIFEERMKKSPCDYVTNHQITVRSNGVATLCQYYHNEIFDFNKYDYDVEEAIDNMNYCKENEISLNDLNYCSKCKYVLNCSSGCRASAEFMTGDILEPDPKACYLHPLVYEKVIKKLPDNVIKTYEQFLNPDGKNPKFTKKDYEKFIKEKGFPDDK